MNFGTLINSYGNNIYGLTKRIIAQKSTLIPLNGTFI